jgi:fumarate reductase (CoM/CoB) subunit A
MLIKGSLGSSGATVWGVAEMAAFNAADGLADPEDNPEEFFRDIMEAAQGMADGKLAALLTEKAPRALRYLEERGVAFEKRNGRHLVIQACFSSRPRSHIIPGHGEPIIRVLTGLIRKSSIHVRENSPVVKILTAGGECCGALVLNQQGRLEALPAEGVILACGGAGRLFANNLNPPDICGDGYTLGFEAGADLTNMEFMQAGLGIVSPIKNILNSWLWAALPPLTNRLGQEFLGNYPDSDTSGEEVLRAHSRHFPFSSRGVSRFLEIAVHEEIRQGRGTPEGGIYLDLRGINDEYLSRLPGGRDLKAMWPITRDFLRKRGLDPAAEPLQAACFAHAVNGGLKIDHRAATTVPGLFAAGECAGGPHGADRLGGNMMVTCQVFGEIAGREAARHVPSSERKKEQAEVLKEETALCPDILTCDVSGTDILQLIAAAAQNNLLVVREESGLQNFLRVCRSISHKLNQCPKTGPNLASWNLHSLLVSGEIMAQACLLRRESRGSHYRRDYPRQNEDMGKPLVLNKDIIHGSGT